MADLHLDDHFAIIALTTPLGLTPSETGSGLPLTVREWQHVATWLAANQRTPRTLLSPNPATITELGNIDPTFSLRIPKLLNRCEHAANAARLMDEGGIWIATIGELGYPRQWQRKFGLAAPPLVYGDGEVTNVDRAAIGIVGSRDISGDLAEIANDVGAAAVLGDYTVVSGGARGTDRIGMNGALEVMGNVVGILPDHLQRERLRRPNRDEIDAGRLTFISVVHPNTAFEVGNAMYRNRLIYALSELTIVISTSDGSGGTWAGAMENLKRRWAPMAVWTGESAPEANNRLIERGAMALDTVPETAMDVRQLVRDATDTLQALVARDVKPVNMTLGLTGD